MKLSIISTVPTERERVYAALVDPAVLRRCIPGCQDLTETAPDAYSAKLRIGVAGLKGAYTGSAIVQDKQPPDLLTLVFDGKGAPGFVRGTAVIALLPHGSETRVDCVADVHVGGLIAAVGSRIVEAAAKKVAEDFFSQLSRELTGVAGL